MSINYDKEVDITLPDDKEIADRVRLAKPRSKGVIASRDAMGKPTKVPRIPVTERRAKLLEFQRFCLKMRLSGAQYVEIANAFQNKFDQPNFTRTDAQRLCEDAMVTMFPVEDVEQLRTLEILRLDHLFQSRWIIALKGDDAAFDRCMRVFERRSKLLGLDAPAKTEVTGKGGAPLQVDMLVAATSLMESLSQRALSDPETLEGHPMDLPPGNEALLTELESMLFEEDDDERTDTE